MSFGAKDSNMINDRGSDNGKFDIEGTKLKDALNLEYILSK